VRCEEARPLLAEMAEGTLRDVGLADTHVAGCPRCSLELASYRELLTRLGELRAVVVEPSDELLERVLAATKRGRLGRRVAGNERVQRAALSLGGAALGATAIALLWWRAARRGLSTAEAVPAAQSAGG
jgi:hypothetical protein